MHAWPAPLPMSSTSVECHWCMIITQRPEFLLEFTLGVVQSMGSVCVWVCVCVCAQSCLTLWDPMDYSPSGFSVHGISQARILEWVVMPSSRGSSWPRDWTHVSCVPSIGRWILYHGTTWEAMDLEKCLMTSIHHYSIRESVSLPPRFSSSPVIPDNHWCFYFSQNVI